MWNPFKKKKSSIGKTRLHKDYKKLMTHAVTIKDGDKEIKFYEFANIEDMPNKRYAILNEFIEDKARGLSKQELAANLDECLKSMQEGGNISDITDAIILIKWMRQRLEIANDMDLIMRLVSCSLFLKDEDVLNYDWDIGTYKIDLFEKHGLKSFFLSEPIRKYWSLTNISSEHMDAIITERMTKIQVSKELKEIGISISDT